MINQLSKPDRANIVAHLTGGLRDLLAEQGDAAIHLDEGTRLVGPEAVLTSLGVVSLIVELEQALEDEYGVTITLADERAMSERHSPFRTVGTLADYTLRLVEETP